jgi:iron(III) transport system substrate-binding protein
VVVYTSLDEEFSDPIFAEFTAQTKLDVRPKFDTESTKTVGLAEAILAERGRPRCDVFWNNEILHTLRLERDGLLQAYHCPLADSYPAMYRSPQGLWYGFAARARVLIVNAKLVPAAERPESILDLTAAKWRGRCGMAKPLFGTTATQAACLFVAWGPEHAKQFYQHLQENQVKILSGNKQVAQAVGGGDLAFGITDTDDAIGEVDKGMPVVLVYPDQHPAGLGTLFIPNTLAIIRGAPHPEAARRLVDYLLSPPVETGLAQGESAQIPLNSAVSVKTRVETPRTIRAMKVDFEAAAAQWDAVARFLRDRFTGG